MPIRGTAIAAMLPLLLLAACGSREPAEAGNGAAPAEGSAAQAPEAPGNSAAADPSRPDAPADGAAEPVPPPDAVSHPNGYLPPAPAEPEPAGSNASGPNSPATEDEYIRNGQ